MRRSIAAVTAVAASTLFALGVAAPATAAVAAPVTAVAQQEVSVVGYWNVDRTATTIPAILAYDVPMFMDIDDKYEFSARVGCNAVFGSVTLAPQDGLANFTSVGSTQMECEQVAMDAERALVTMLDHAVLKYTLTENKLVLSNDAGDVLAFTR